MKILFIFLEKSISVQEIGYDGDTAILKLIFAISMVNSFYKACELLTSKVNDSLRALASRYRLKRFVKTFHECLCFLQPHNLSGYTLGDN